MGGELVGSVRPALWACVPQHGPRAWLAVRLGGAELGQLEGFAGTSRSGHTALCCDGSATPAPVPGPS